MKICDLIKTTKKAEAELALFRLQVKMVMYKEILEKKGMKVKMVVQEG